MSKPRVLVVGGGSIGERHLRCFLHTDEASVSICESRPDHLEYLKQTYDVDEACADFDATDLSSFDAVVICTPPNLHIPMALRAVDAGCHVLSEKPLSGSLDGVDELIARVESKGLVAGVAFVLRHMTSHAKIRELIHGGEIGDVKLALYKTGQQFSKFRPDYKGIYFASRAMGGGAINDSCSHTLNFLQWCFGDPTEVTCFHDHLSDMEIETEDAALMTLRYGPKGPMVQTQHYLCQRDYAIFLECVGTKGTLRLEGTFEEGRAKTALRVFRANEEKWVTYPLPGSERDGWFVAQAQHFLAAMRGERPVMSTLQEGREVVRTCVAARQSYEAKRIMAL